MLIYTGQDIDRESYKDSEVIIGTREKNFNVRLIRQVVDTVRFADNKGVNYHVPANVTLLIKKQTSFIQDRTKKNEVNTTSIWVGTPLSDLVGIPSVTVKDKHGQEIELSNFIFKKDDFIVWTSHAVSFVEGNLIF